MRRVLTCLIVLACLTTAAHAAYSFDALVNDYIADFFVRNPTTATYDGIHTYDDKLEDYSRTGIDRNLASLKAWRIRFEAVDRKKLTELQRDDLDLVLNDIRSSILEIERIRSWEKNPDKYSSGLSSSIFCIVSRNFAPAEARMASVIAREGQVNAVLAAARANLSNPPKIYTEIAIEQLPGTIDFFQKDVPLALKEVKDPELLARFNAATNATVHALRDYQKWLKDDLLPRSKGDFRIGAENFSLKLRYEEMVDLPLPRLLEIGYADLKRNQNQFRAVAAQLDAKADPKAVLATLATDHPAPDKLLQSFRDVLDGLRDYIDAHHIVTIPSRVKPILEETPPFERATTMASMDTPGPFEKTATEAYFNVTLPEPGWSKEQIAEHMAGFTYGTIISTAIHEAYPGHYVQFLWMPQAPTRARKIFGCSTNVEGWAHYTEQMMLDEGYGNGDLKLRLGQLQDALLRNARFIVGIKMHTGEMTFDQAVDFFVNEGYQSRANGLRETKRGTADPTYLYYTLGKLEILKLRDDYRKLKGSAFTIGEFHDTFLRQGSPPIPLIRKAMLGTEGNAL